METGTNPDESATTTFPHAMHDDPLIGELFMVRQLVFQYFQVNAIMAQRTGYRFEASGTRGQWADIRRAFQKIGFTAYRTRWGDRIICTLVRRRRERTAEQKRELRISWILFVITILSTLFAGIVNAQGVSKNITQLILNTVGFSLSLMLILGTHEMGHKLAAIRNGIEASPPMFIPFPLKLPIMIGTFGAFIRLRSRMPDDNAASEMGISGPLAGFLVAIPVVFIGAALSQTLPMEVMKTGAMYTEFAEPPIMKLITQLELMRRGIPYDKLSHYTLLMHPVLFAGWVGMLVTMLNLLPIGQLDGGHIARALLGPKYHRGLSYAIVALLIVLGMTTHYLGWFVWAGITSLFLRLPYPSPAGIIQPITARNILIAAIGIIILILCFMPMPIRVV